MIEGDNFTVEHGSVRLFARLWAPESPLVATALIVVSHGLGEHSGRYIDFANFFRAANYAVVAFDHEGHGQSSGKPGTLSAEQSLLSEIVTVAEAARARLSAKPAITLLWGHSMGALLSLEALRQPLLAKHFKAGVLTGVPLILGFVPPKILAALAAPVAALFPNLTKPNDLDQTALSRDRAVIERYANDPFVHDRVSMRLGEMLLRYPKALLATASSIRIPLLLMHGELDRIGTFEGSRRYVELNRTHGAEFRSWPGLYHEIHNEPERLEVLAFAKTWFDQQITRP